MQDKDTTGIVFNIQKFSVHDGEGIRTLVFLKGCPLHCLWCCNPESQNFKPEHAFNPLRCLSVAECGRCIKKCTHHALEEHNGKLCFDKKNCEDCGSCVFACPSHAQSFYGESMTVDEVLNKVEEDNIFYSRSGGGLTLSGGEALAQPDFTLALLREAKRRHIHTTVETCGHCPREVIESVCKTVDALIMDLKSMNAEKHKEFTGVSNKVILDNAKHIITNFPHLPITFRTPVVPSFNDTKEDIFSIREFIPLQDNIKYQLLTYHRMGEPKYEYIGKDYVLKGAKADEGLMAELKKEMSQYSCVY